MALTQAQLTERRCAHCGAILLRRPNEPPNRWARRRHCNSACYGKRVDRPAIERFSESYEPDLDTGCWLWAAHTMPNGYGRLRDDLDKAVQAHRFAYRHFKGPILPGLYVCHRCDVRRCVNPDHLWLGSAADNASDCVAKRRSLSGERNPAAKLNRAGAERARALYAAGETQINIAALLGISQPTVSAIIVGRIWRASECLEG